MRIRRAGGLLAAVALAATALAGCTPHPTPTGGAPTTLPAPSGSTSAPGEQATDPADAAFYDQHPEWSDCGDGLQCTTVTVPVDWSAPAGATLALALDRWPATDRSARVGSLLVDPGGPGGSGVDWVRAGGRDIVSKGLAARYDVVGFDPRGVGASSGVDCLSDRDMDAYLAADVDPDTPAGLTDLTTRARAFAAGCEASAGPLLGHLGTVDAARDMDVLRAVLGQQRLDYLGKSYGTLLGATYAGLFPARVGRFVLDGALDPASSFDDVALVQAGGLERSLRAYVTDCPQRRGCPLSSDTDTALGQIRAVIARSSRTPLRTGTARPLTEPLTISGIITPLYDDAVWPALDQGLSQAMKGDGSVLLRLADAYADRNADGTYGSNLLEAFTAVDCLDYPVDDDPAAMKAQEAALEAASPTFGRSLAYGEVQCGLWPVPPTRTPGPISARGAAPILVVGTTDDPATPYQWAQALSTELASARLLTWRGEGHTAYRRGSSCVDDAVDAYLLEGVLPGQGATCSS